MDVKDKGRSSRQFSNQYLKLQVLKLASLTYDRASSTAISTLGDVSESFFHLFASLTQTFANSANRQKANLQDISSALNFLKMKPHYLSTFAKDLRSSLQTRSTSSIIIPDSVKNTSTSVINFAALLKTTPKETTPSQQTPYEGASATIPLEDFLPPLYLDTIYPDEEDLDDFLWSLLSSDDDDVEEEEEGEKKEREKEESKVKVEINDQSDRNDKTSPLEDVKLSNSALNSPDASVDMVDKEDQPKSFTNSITTDDSKKRKEKRLEKSDTLDSEPTLMEFEPLERRKILLNEAIEAFFPSIPNPSTLVEGSNSSKMTNAEGKEKLDSFQSNNLNKANVCKPKNSNPPIEEKKPIPGQSLEKALQNSKKVNESFIKAISSLSSHELSLNEKKLHPTQIHPKLAHDTNGSFPSRLISKTFPVLNTMYHDAIDSVYATPCPLSSSSKVHETIPPHLENLSSKIMGRRKSSIHLQNVQDLFDKPSLSHDELEGDTEADSMSEVESRSIRADSNNSQPPKKKKRLAGSDGNVSDSPTQAIETTINLSSDHENSKIDIQPELVKDTIPASSPPNPPKIRLKVKP